MDNPEKRLQVIYGQYSGPRSTVLCDILPCPNLYQPSALTSILYQSLVELAHLRREWQFQKRMCDVRN